MAFSSTVVFNDGVNPIVRVNAPSIGGSASYQVLPTTVTEESANRTLWSYQLTSKQVRLWPLTFNTLTQTMKDDLLDFFFNKAIGPTNTFNYHHSDGTTYPGVRFANDDFPVTRSERNKYNVALTLRITDQAITSQD